MAKTAQRTPLSRDAIAAAAMALADESGVSKLSMRKLAASLGFEVMSLYNHVANKADLLALMTDAVAAEMAQPDPALEPLQAIRAMAISTRETLQVHPWAPQIWHHHLPGPARAQQMEDLLRLFDESGLAPDLAHHGFHAINNHVIGYTIQQLEMEASLEPAAMEELAQEFLATTPIETHPFTVAHVHLHLDGKAESSFELVLDLILDGLVALNRSR